MRQLLLILLLRSILVFTSCKTTSKSSYEKTTEQTLEEKNRGSVSLLNRIQRLQGISLRNSVPTFAKASNSLQASGEPLYVLNDYIVGNSLNSVNELVDSFNVKK